MRNNGLNFVGLGGTLVAMLGLGVACGEVASPIDGAIIDGALSDGAGQVDGAGQIDGGGGGGGNDAAGTPDANLPLPTVSIGAPPTFGQGCAVTVGVSLSGSVIGETLTWTTAGSNGTTTPASGNFVVGTSSSPFTMMWSPTGTTSATVRISVTDSLSRTVMAQDTANFDALTACK